MSEMKNMNLLYAYVYYADNTETSIIYIRILYIHITQKNNVAHQLKPGEILAIHQNYSINPQNVLEMNVTHNNYVDPNNLMFEEIRILGLLQEPESITVSQNNNVQNSSHTFTYDPVNKVKLGKKCKNKVKNRKIGRTYFCVL